jgi:hypothetical protein
MADKDTPTRSSNMEKAEGDRNTVGDADTTRRSEWGEGTSEGGGITNRPLGEEVKNQEEMPDRDEGNDDTQAG